MACNISSHTHPQDVVITGFDPTRAVFAGSAHINKSVSFLAVSSSWYKSVPTIYMLMSIVPAVAVII